MVVLSVGNGELLQLVEYGPWNLGADWYEPDDGNQNNGSVWPDEVGMRVENGQVPEKNET